MSENGTVPQDNIPDNNFESPNIKSSSGEEIPSISDSSDKTEETTNPQEKVLIDGIPIAEKDITFHAKDIKKKDESELFTNVEGAERRARIEARKKQEEERRIEKELIEEERAHKERIERHKREEKEVAEANKRNEKKRKRKFKRDVAIQKYRDRRKKRIKFFFGGKRKFVTIGLIIVAVLTISHVIYYKQVTEPARIAAEISGPDGTREINNVTDEVDRMYEEGTSVDDCLSYIQKKINDSKTDIRREELSVYYGKFLGIYKNHEEGIKYLENVFEQTNESSIKYATLMGISTIYDEMGDANKYEEYFDKAQEYEQ